MVNVLETTKTGRPKWGQEPQFEVERGPGWLFVRLPDSGELGPGLWESRAAEPGERHEGNSLHVENLADQLWTLLNKHFVYRLVLEMDQVRLLSSSMMGQLVMLQKRVLQHGGALRLCGLSPQCQQALHLCRLDQVMPNYRNREDAVLGCGRTKPR